MAAIIGMAATFATSLSIVCEREIGTMEQVPSSAVGLLISTVSQS